MTALSIQPTFPIFTDIDGQPLESGYIWIGTTNLNPITNPITVYWDAALTLAAVQPIRTIGGYPVNSGTPARLYVNSDYSIQVQNRNGSVVYSAPAATERFSDVVVNSIDSSEVSFIQAGLGAVTRTAQSKMRDVVSVKDFGAGAGGADDGPEIQAAVDAVFLAGGGTIYFPAGTYNLQTQVIPKNGVNYLGEGKESLLVWNSTSGGYFFNQASTDLENVTWDNLGFDGTINYITDPTIYKQTYTRRNTAIRTGGVAAKNVTVRNCFFKNISNGSIDFNGDFSDGIFVLNNTFINGCYCFKVVAVRTPSGSPVSDAGRPQNILFDGNYLSGGGPTGFYDASKEDWIASCDGLDVDSCKDVIISNNTVVGIASIGIRVEQTLRAKVIGNTVKETGNTGITFYNDCFDGVCVGNTVENWGRIPPAYAIRSFGGVYYAAQEFPDSTLAPLPANPSVAAWFYVWPYALTGVNASTIIPYANTQYYPAVNGINPFRGDAAIAVTQGSQKINVVGNNIVGNITTSGGLFNYASDYGITCITPGNAPGGQTFAPLNSMITGNGVTDARVYRIWHPQFGDPIHYNTASYNTGQAVYSANRDSSSLIWSGNIRFAQDGQLIANVSSGSSGRSNFQANWVNFPSVQVASADANTLDDYEEGAFAVAITPASGSVTMNFTVLQYTKVGRLVTVTGECNALSVSTPGGAVTIGNLPFPNSGNSQRSSRTTFYVRASSFTGGPLGVCSGYIDPNASVIDVSAVNNFVSADIGANLQAGTAFIFSFSYMTTT
jgi:hypothetical protein